MNISVSVRNLTVERIEQIKRVYERGMTSAQIAGAVNHHFGDEMTRRAVIGLYYRYPDELMNYPLPPAPSRARISNKDRARRERENEAKRERRRRARIEREKNPSQQPERPAPKPRPAKAPEIYDASALLKRMFELEARECRWPIAGAGADTLFCGHEASGTYCDHHRQRSTGVGTISERRAAGDLRRASTL